jgi:chaperone modulatory protein CbpM
MSDESAVTGILIDEEGALTLVEFCGACDAEFAFVVELVAEGVLRPSGGEPGAWRFTGAELRRARLAIRLRSDLDLDLAGVALGVQLLEEIRELRSELAALRRLPRRAS